MLNGLSLEAQLLEERLLGREASLSSLITLQGSLPIVLSCPHARMHPRLGKMKPADLFTGPLGMQLAAFTGASAIIYARTTDEDPNYDVYGPYKEALKHLCEKSHARFVLDLHGMSSIRSYDIALGTAFGKTFPNIHLFDMVIEILQDTNFKSLLINDPRELNASWPHTITSFTWNALHIPALEIEIHRRYRNPYGGPENYVQLFFTLSKIIQHLAQVSTSSARAEASSAPTNERREP